MTTPEKSRRKWDSNPRSSALEVDTLTTRPTRRSVTHAALWLASHCDTKKTHAIILTEPVNLLQKVKCLMGRPGRHAAMYRIQLQRRQRIVSPGHAGVRGNEAAGRLAGNRSNYNNDNNSNNNNNDDDDDDNNSNKNNNNKSHSKQQFEIFFLTISSLRRLQHARSSGPGAIVCKSRVTCRVTCHVVLRDISATKFNRV